MAKETDPQKIAALKAAEQRNDQRMTAMMVEMTRFFCGETKAAEIANGFEQFGKTGGEIDPLVDQARFQSVADQLQRAGITTIEAALIDHDWPVTLRELVGGLLWYATTPGVSLTYLGRGDWALHFVFGAWLELTLGLGDAAGAFKERWDALGHGDPDPKDELATKHGAAWVRLHR